MALRIRLKEGINEVSVSIGPVVGTFKPGMDHLVSREDWNILKGLDCFEVVKEKPKRKKAEEGSAEKEDKQ